MAGAVVIAAGIGATVSIVGGIMERRRAEEARGNAEREQQRINREIEIFEINLPQNFYRKYHL